MASKNLTKAFLDDLKPRAGRRSEFTDTKQIGLTVRVSQRGEITFTATYRVSGQGGVSASGRPRQGPTHRLNLGRYPTLGLKAARDLTEEYRDMATAGKDPAQRRHQEIMTRRADERLTFGVVAQEFEAAALRGERVGPRGAISRSYLASRQLDLKNMVLPLIEHRPLADLTTTVLRATLNTINDEEKTAEHRHRVDNALKSIRCIFSYAVRVGYLEDSPAEKLSNRYPNEVRDRYLDAGEVFDLWTVTGEHGYPFGTAIRLMLLLGQRRTEIGKMRWRDVNLETSILTLPMVVTKSDRANEVPLGTVAMSLLQAIPLPRGEFVFSTLGGAKPISGWGKYKKRLDRDMKECPDWRLHDLRRTAVTGMASLGVELRIVELIINHKVPMLLGYNRFAYMDERRDALERWATIVVSSPPSGGGVVVDLNERRQA